MSGRFTTRPTRYVETSTINGWRLKRYEITLDDTPVARDVNSAIDRLLADALPLVVGEADAVGFVVIHRGTEQVWLLADLWHADIVHQNTFFADLDAPTIFEAVPLGGPTACVWELAVHAHERNAYIAHVLDPTDGPDIDAYLADVLAIPPRSHRRLLEEFNDSWARRDVEALMDLMADDPTYRASTGDTPGTEHRGRDAVREGFSDVIAAEASSSLPSPPSGDIHIVDDRGFSMWSYPTIGPDGTACTVEGIDVWTFDNGRIATKDAYRKSFADPRRISSDGGES